MAAQTVAQREYQRQYRERNRERIASYKSAWLKRNRVEQTTRKRERRAANREAINTYNREYRQRDPERTKMLKRLDHLRRRGGAVSAAWIDVLRADPCSYCYGSASEVDHIVPVATGGTSADENLTAACRCCNARKYDRSLLIFMVAS